MKISFKRSYKSQKGNTVFVYTVKGTPKQIADYKAAQGDLHREDTETGESLWFTTRFVGDRGELIITDKGKIVPDMSAFEKAASLSKQYGGNFGNELARAAVANLMGSSASQSEAKVETPAAPADLSGI